MTQELRERVARALAAAHGYEPDALTYREADAAIALVLEEAAKVAMVLEEDRVSMPCPDGIKGCGVFHFRRVKRPRTALEIAAAIRALAAPSGAMKEGK